MSGSQDSYRFACPTCGRLLRKLPQGKKVHHWKWGQDPNDPDAYEGSRIFYGYRENNYLCVNKKCAKQWYLAGAGTYFVERPDD